MRLFALFLLTGILAGLPAELSGGRPAPLDEALFRLLPLARHEASLLHRWYWAVGTPLVGENFGSFLSRTARQRLGTSYAFGREPAGPETLHLELARLECVSFVEASLAVARCAWRGKATEECFAREVMASRYRHGVMTDYASRLHYFTDWIDDNQRRRRLQNVTAELGGVAVRKRFDYLTKHAAWFPPLASPSMRQAMAIIEAELTSAPHLVVGRNRIREAVNGLRDGDLVAFVSNKPGRLVAHAGFIARNKNGWARLVHASTYHGRVVMTRRDAAHYVLRRAERRGIIVSRPLAP